MQQRRSAKNQSNEDDLDVASSTASASRSSQSTRAGRGRSENQQAIISTRHQSSHRSRAGCWTCRERKVKCGEERPICSQCVRLNRTCNWEQRWKFDDSTEVIVKKYSNFSTAANVSRVGESSDAAVSIPDDALPTFKELITDEDREIKAERSPPGTYNVIVNPTSFRSLPEYASIECPRRGSVNETMISQISQSQSLSPLEDYGPNVVVLPRFEDAAPVPSGLLVSPIEYRRQSLSTQLHRLNILNTTSNTDGQPLTTPLSPIAYDDEQLLNHYKHFISPRIFTIAVHSFLPDSPDPILLAARTFLPLHHAICALSLLSLYYQGHYRLETIIEREGLGTKQLRELDNLDVDSDGVFYYHFIMLVHDASYPPDETAIASPSEYDDVRFPSLPPGGIHLRQLGRLATSRNGDRPTAALQDWLILGFALSFDAQAAMTGSDMQTLAAAHSNGAVLTCLPFRLRSMPPLLKFEDQDMHMFQAVSAFCCRMMGMNVKIGQAALRCRKQQEQSDDQDQSRLEWDETIKLLSVEAWREWHNAYPISVFPMNDPTAAKGCTPRIRQIFETAFMYHCINMTYLSTSMYSGQLVPDVASAQVIDQHCKNILLLAETIYESPERGRPSFAFACFLVSVTAFTPSYRTTAEQLILEINKHSIRRNHSRVYELMRIIWDEEIRTNNRVDWWTIAKQHNINLTDFGM